LIARVLRESKYMRELGEGMKRIFESVEQRDIEKPKLHTDTTSFSITLFNRTIYTPQQELWLSVFRDYQLTPLQKRIVVAGMGDQPLGRHDIVSAMRNQDRDTYDSTVTRLRKLGILIETRTNVAAARISRTTGIPKDRVHRFQVVVPSTKRPSVPAQISPTTPAPTTSSPPSVEQPAIGSAERRVFFQFRVAQGQMNISDLQRVFQRCGVVERVDMPVWQDGTQRGFGFVWYETRESAQLAVAQLNGASVSGQRLVVEAYDTGR